MSIRDRAVRYESRPSRAARVSPRRVNGLAVGHAEDMRKVVVVAMVAVLAMTVTSCNAGSLGQSSSSPAAPTTVAAPAATIVAYPPMPRPPSEAAQDCATLPRVGLTASAAQQIINDVTAAATKEGQVQVIGACVGGPVTVQLAPGNETFAHVLWLRYGRKISISVGLTAYSGSPGRSPRCGVLADPSKLPVGLEVSLDLASTSIPSDSPDFTGMIVVNEDGPGTFSMDIGQPLLAVIVLSGTRQVVGLETGGIGGTGRLLNLAPGMSVTVSVVGGTARCDGGIGSALPPGRYDVIVRVAPETEPQTPSYLTAPIPIQVT